MNIVPVSNAEASNNESSDILNTQLLLQSVAHKEDNEDCGHIISDVWVGVILTLLVISVVFMICAGLLLHKFQQWKESYCTRNRTSFQIYHNCNANTESTDAESLPSYTIVSGLPSYDDALEQYRHSLGSKIILKPNAMIKIFEKTPTNKDNSMSNEADLGQHDTVYPSVQPESENPDHVMLPLPCQNAGTTLTISTISMPIRILRPHLATNHFAANYSRSQRTQFNRKRFSIQSIFQSQRHPDDHSGHCINCNGQQFLTSTPFTLPIATTFFSANTRQNSTTSENEVHIGSMIFNDISANNRSLTTA